LDSISLTLFALLKAPTFGERKLIIELDGGQHALPEEVLKDNQRDAWLKKEGYAVVRFWDNEVLTNTSGVLELIRERFHRTPSPQSPPLTNSRGLKPGRGSKYQRKMRQNHKKDPHSSTKTQ